MSRIPKSHPITRQWVEDRFEKQEALLEQSEQRQTVELKQFIQDTVNKAADESEKRILRYIKQTAVETKHYFDVVAENIHKDVAGANKDKVSLLGNKSDDHEERITVLEQTAGLR